MRRHDLVYKLDHVLISRGLITREYGGYEAKTKLPDLIEQVQQGERITTTNRGKPVADLIPSASRVAQQTIEAIAAVKAMHTGTIDQAEFLSMRLRGRR
ncbi:MAG: type II toxin-antitoxin system Phd/YefM family antitoxin [Sulfuriferula sp.]